MYSLPSAAEPLFMSFSIAFTEPTFQRILPLLAGAILTRGRRTITAMYGTLWPVIPGHGEMVWRRSAAGPIRQRDRPVV